jgi:hypothetical protein
MEFEPGVNFIQNFGETTAQGTVRCLPKIDENLY